MEDKSVDVKYVVVHVFVNMQKKEQIVQCDESELCKHGRQKYACKQCGGSAIYVYDVIKQFCLYNIRWWFKNKFFSGIQHSCECFFCEYQTNVKYIFNNHQKMHLSEYILKRKKKEHNQKHFYQTIIYISNMCIIYPIHVQMLQKKFIHVQILSQNKHTSGTFGFNP